jgi:hypothetical protein
MLDYATFDKLQKATEGLPQEVLDKELTNILEAAGQKVPTNVQDIFERFLTENISPEKIANVLSENGLEFFKKEIPTEHMDYSIPGGS